MIKVELVSGEVNYYTTVDQLFAVLGEPEAAEALDGARYSGVSEGEAIDTRSIDELFALSQKRARRSQMRERIWKSCGDTKSLLGTTSDAAQFLVVAFFRLTVALHKANSLAEVREAAGPFNDLATAFLGKVDSGEVKLPFQVKGVDSVMAEIETRATAVAEEITSALT